MYVYLLWEVIESGDDHIESDTSEEVLEGVFATREAAKNRADRGMGIVLSPKTYRIERRGVKG